MVSVTQSFSRPSDLGGETAKRLLGVFFVVNAEISEIEYLSWSWTSAGGSWEIQHELGTVCVCLEARGDLQ